MTYTKYSNSKGTIIVLLLDVSTCPVVIPSGTMLIIVSVLKSGTGCLCRLVRNGSISST